MTLEERLAQVDRSIVVRDTVAMIDREVGSKSGLSGMALKTGYKVIKKLKNGRMVENAVDDLLDDFTRVLDPIYTRFLAQDEIATFERYLREHDAEAANAMLAITDAKAERADNKVLRSTYGKLRPTAEKHVRDTLPGVGRVIDRHAPKT